MSTIEQWCIYTAITARCISCNPGVSWTKQQGVGWNVPANSSKNGSQPNFPRAWGGQIAGDGSRFARIGWCIHPLLLLTTPGPCCLKKMFSAKRNSDLFRNKLLFGPRVCISYQYSKGSRPERSHVWAQVMDVFYVEAQNWKYCHFCRNIETCLKDFVAPLLK